MTHARDADTSLRSGTHLEYQNPLKNPGDRFPPETAQYHRKCRIGIGPRVDHSPPKALPRLVACPAYPGEGGVQAVSRIKRSAPLGVRSAAVSVLNSPEGTE